MPSAVAIGCAGGWSGDGRTARHHIGAPLDRLDQKVVTAMSVLYRDRWIECTADAIRIRGYYFPWGTKTIRYSAIRSVHKVMMGALTGRG